MSKKKPFSAKQKKAQLQEKRKKKDEKRQDAGTYHAHALPLHAYRTSYLPRRPHLSLSSSQRTAAPGVAAAHQSAEDGLYSGQATLVASQQDKGPAAGPALPLGGGVVLMNEQPHNPRTKYNPNR